MALQTSTVSVAGYDLKHHVSKVSSPRGRVVSFHGDRSASATNLPSGVTDMAAAANAHGLDFYAPMSPIEVASTGLVQWWANASESTAPATLARAYVDQVATTKGLTYLVGHSGGSVLINKDLAKVGSWPGKFTGGALSFGGGSTTNAVSTPVAWRPGFPMHWDVGELDGAGQGGTSGWSALDKARAASGEFAAAGHPIKLTILPDTGHTDIDFGGRLASFLDSVMPRVQAPAPDPTGPSAVTVLESMPDEDLRIVENADDLVRAAVTVGIPLHVAAAMVSLESRGRNVYGADYGGIYSPNPSPVTVDGVTYTGAQRVPVTPQNYARFQELLLNADGTRRIDPATGKPVISNGVGPTQATWWEYHRDAPGMGIDLSVPLQNMIWGLRILASYLAGDYTRGSVEVAGTKYNAGTGYFERLGVNDYGRALWVRAEAFRVALAGSTMTIPGEGGDVPVEGPAPVVDDPSQPPHPEPVATSDPGPRVMGEAAEYTPQPLPVVADGPLRTGGDLAVARARVHFRGKWLSPVSGGIARELAFGGPDQATHGAGVQAATGEVVLARPLVLSDRGWSAWIDAPPRTGERVLIEITLDDGETWTRKFTGKVRDSSGSLDELGVTMRIQDDTNRLSKNVRLPAVGARHPSPLDGGRWLTPGLHPTWVVSSAVRQCGFYATPPMPSSALVSVPMLGSMWPERGTLTHCQAIAEKGASEAVAADVPRMARTWWGLTPSNVWARYRPYLPTDRLASMKNTWGIRMLVGRPQDYPAFVELYWPGDTSIMVQVKKDAIVVETQRGYLSNGWRRVLHSRTRTLTAAQREGKGFQLDLWLHSGGKVEIGIDGDFHVYEDSPIKWPTEMVDGDLQEVRVAVRPQATRVGGLIVAVTADRRQLGAWQRDYQPDVDSWTQLAGTPEVSHKPAIEIVREYAESLLSTVWIDGGGVLRDVSRAQMDARPSERTLTLDDVQTPPWRLDQGAAVSVVDVEYQVPTMDHRRLSAAARSEVWEGPRDTLEPGQTWEQIITIPDSEDWIDVDRALSELGLSTVGRVNHGVGSWIGGTLVAPPESDEKVFPSPVPIYWYSTAAWTAGPRQIGLRVVYNPPPGETRHMEMSTAEIEGMWRTYIGRGPILRARAKQTWSQGTLPAPVHTGAALEEWVQYTHPGGRWVQSGYVAASLADRLRHQYASALPVWGPMVMGVPDPHLDLGDTITLLLDEVRAPQRISSEDLSFDAREGIRQVFSIRQIRS